MPKNRSTQRLQNGIPPADWDLLFNAVTEKLRQSATQLAIPAARDMIEDCIGALGLLHAAQGAQAGQMQQMQSQLRSARKALKAAHAEVSAMEARELMAQQMSMLDSLTELPNRRHFNRRADDVLGAGQGYLPALSVLFVDLDDFKPVNDLHGHEVGDLLLRGVAQRLRESVDAADVVCRLGGDEFACLMPRQLGRDQLCKLAGRIFDSVASPLTIGALEFNVRASIGIAIFPSDGQTTAALLQRADSAMYRAKSQQLGYAFAGDQLPAAGRALRA